MRRLSAIFLALAIILGGSPPARGLNLGMTPAQAGAILEFYYQNPRPKILPAMLRALSPRLENGECRLVVAAFLSQLARRGDINIGKIADELKTSSGGLRKTLAWAAHLAGKPDEKRLLGKLLGPSDGPLKWQLGETPASLAEWDPASQKSAVPMFWAAFSATGGQEWIGRGIDAALAQKGGQAAAALYEAAARHPAVMQAVKERKATASGPAKKILEAVIGP